jgi:hypothetical protein
MRIRATIVTIWTIGKKDLPNIKRHLCTLVVGKEGLPPLERRRRESLFFRLFQPVPPSALERGQALLPNL